MWYTLSTVKEIPKMEENNMIVDKMENGVWTRTETESKEVLCKIENLGNNIYRATNKFTQVTAEIIPLDDYMTQTKCIENKRVDKNGRFRKTNTLADHNTMWLCYMLQEYGFIRKAKVSI